MPRKLTSEDLACQSRRWSSRRKPSRSPSPIKQSRSRAGPPKSPNKTRLPPPPSSPLSATVSSDSMFDGLGYQNNDTLPSTSLGPLGLGQSPPRVTTLNANANQATRQQPIDASPEPVESTPKSPLVHAEDVLSRRNSASASSNTTSVEPTTTSRFSVKTKAKPIKAKSSPKKRKLSTDITENTGSGPCSQRRRKNESCTPEVSRPEAELEAESDNEPDRFCGDFKLLFDQLEREGSPVKEVPPSPAVEEAKTSKPRKEVRKPTTLPVEVSIGSTCLYLFRSSWFLAKLVGFEPGPTLARDIYVVQARDIPTERRAKRADILFLHEPKVKTLRTLGGLSAGKIDPDYYKSDAYTRAATPPPESSAEADTIPFDKQTRQAQLYHIRPHLLRIIRNEYSPALPRMKAFYLDEKVNYLTGDWCQEELSNFFAPELTRWLLRPNFDTIPNQDSRPTGSDSFEALNDADKKKFLVNVLIPESLIQLDILLYGQSPDLLSQSEQKQYKLAAKRLLKRGRQRDPWEIPEMEAHQAMGRFSKELTEEEAAERLIKQGTHYISFAGTERVTKKVDYRTQL